MHRNGIFSSIALAGLAALCAAGLPSRAAAQETNGETADEEGDAADKAQKYYKQGMKAFYAKDYAIAITNFKRAHNFSPAGTLLYNISIAYSRIGKPKEAMSYAKRAADFDDLPEDTVLKNDARIAGYAVALRADRMLPSKQVREVDTAGDSDAPPRRADGDRRVGGGGALRWIGAGTGLAGAGILTSAAVVNFDVQQKIDDKNAAQKAGNLERANRLYDQITSQQQTGRILLYAGGGALALGATLFFVDLASSGSTEGRALRIVGGASPMGWSLGLDADF